jgi:hypothetical protein
MRRVPGLAKQQGLAGIQRLTLLSQFCCTRSDQIIEGRGYSTLKEPKYVIGTHLTPTVWLTQPTATAEEVQSGNFLVEDRNDQQCIYSVGPSEARLFIECRRN